MRWFALLCLFVALTVAPRAPRIVVLAAFEVEAAPLRAQMIGLPVMIVLTGAGLSNAARITQQAIEQHHPQLVLMIGTAGALDPGLEIGDVLAPAVWVAHPEGRPRYTVDSSLLALLDGQDGVSVGGLGLSGDVFVADPQQRQSLRERFPGARSVDMESAAVARIAFENGVSFIALRAISDHADGSDAAALQSNVRLAAQNAADIAAILILRLSSGRTP